MAQPYTPAPGGVDYYTHQRKMWSKLAAQPGAGQALKDLAAAATAMHRAREQGRA